MGGHPYFTAAGYSRLGCRGICIKTLTAVPLPSSSKWWCCIQMICPVLALWMQKQTNHYGLIWTFGDNSHEICYFFNGTNIFNLHLWKGRPPAYDVGFHGPGKSSVWWWSLGRETFIIRNFFNTNGELSKHEVLYNQAWHTGVEQEEKIGIVINGQWRQLSLHTNAMWAVKPDADMP